MHGHWGLFFPQLHIVLTFHGCGIRCCAKKKTIPDLQILFIKVNIICKVHNSDCVCTVVSGCLLFVCGQTSQGAVTSQSDHDSFSISSPYFCLHINCIADVVIILQCCVWWIHLAVSLFFNLTDFRYFCLFLC